MSSVSDFLQFLSNGQPPPSVPTYDQSSHQLPTWYNDYTQQILNRTSQFANEPYTPYTGPRVAPVNPMTGMAAQQLVGMNTPANVGANPNFYSTAASMLGGSGTAGAAPAAGTPGALGASAPYAGITAGGFPTNAAAYMNPYTANVTDEIARLGTRNMQEKLLPALQDEFIRTGGGGYGLNTAEGGAAGRMGRDVQADILGQQTQSLERGYTNAANIYNQDYGNQIQGIGALGNMGNYYQGQQQKNLDTAYQDFLTQQQYPQTQTKNMADILQGLKIPDATVNYGYGPYSGNMGTSPLGQIGQLGMSYMGLKELLGSGSGSTSGSGTNWTDYIGSLMQNGASSPSNNPSGSTGDPWLDNLIGL